MNRSVFQFQLLLQNRFPFLILMMNSKGLHHNFVLNWQEVLHAIQLVIHYQSSRFEKFPFELDHGLPSLRNSRLKHLLCPQL